MKTVAVQVFTFAELSEKAKERARDWYREASAGDELLTDYALEDFARIAEIFGIEFEQRKGSISGRPRPAVYFSGFGNQGDGAQFAGTYSFAPDASARIREYAPADEKLHAIADALTRHGEGLDARVTASGRYSHEYATTIEVYRGDETVAAPELEDALRDFMRWIYRYLESENDYRNSNEYVDECITANEYEFTESGRRFTLPVAPAAAPEGSK